MDICILGTFHNICDHTTKDAKATIEEMCVLEAVDIDWNKSIYTIFIYFLLVKILIQLIYDQNRCFFIYARQLNTTVQTVQNVQNENKIEIEKDALNSMQQTKHARNRVLWRSDRCAPRTILVNTYFKYFVCILRAMRI